MAEDMTTEDLADRALEAWKREATGVALISKDPEYLKKVAMSDRIAREHIDIAKPMIVAVIREAEQAAAARARAEEREAITVLLEKMRPKSKGTKKIPRLMGGGPFKEAQAKSKAATGAMNNLIDRQITAISARTDSD